MGKVANDTVFAKTLAEARELVRTERYWVVLAGAGLVIGLTGPFGTFDDLILPLRAAYWWFVVTTTFWCGYLTSFVIVTLAENRGVDGIAGLLAGAIAAGILVSTWLAAFHVVVFATDFWQEMYRLLPYALVISVVVVVGWDYAETRIMPVNLPATPPGIPTWLDQLPRELGKNLILLQAEDHYVRAETDRGQVLLRTTLQDAAEALGDYGVRLHRSWWVAKDAIATYQYRNGAPAILLHDGRVVPIGRTYRRAVKDALR